MIKKVVLGTGLAVALSTFVFGTDVFSYLRTGAGSVRQAVRAEVPLDFEIARARQSVEEIIPEIEQVMHVIAEQQYDLERRDVQIAAREESLVQQKQAILALRTDLDANKANYVYAGRNYDQQDVRQDLAHRFERFKTAEQTLQRDHKVTDARRRALAANEEKLDNMLSVKKDLAVQIENLEARLAAVDATEAISELHIDDSSLSRAKELISELDRRIGTREKLLSNETRFTGEIPVEADRQSQDAAARADAVESEVDAYFGAGPQAGI